MAEPKSSPYGNIEFAPYERVPFGLEWARDRTESGNGNLHGGARFVDADGVAYIEFELMHNAWMAKPEWDAELRAIDDLLRDVEPLDDDARIMRLQIAGYRACAYTFPESTLSLLESIGKGAADRELAIGCGWHFGDLTDPERHRRVQGYLSALSAWADGRGLEECLDAHDEYPQDVRRIYELLGEHSHLKSLLARRFALLLDLLDRSDSDSMYYRYGYPQAAALDRQILAAADIAPEVAEALVQTGMALGAMPKVAESDRDAFGDRSWEVYPVWASLTCSGEAPCHGNFIRHCDLLTAGIGAGALRGGLPETGEYRRQVESAVASIACALDGWLAGLDVNEAAQPWPDSRDTCDKVYTLLGEPTPLKRFLVARLWKKMKLQKGTGLLQAHPESFRARWLVVASESA